MSEMRTTFHCYCAGQSPLLWLSQPCKFSQKWKCFRVLVHRRVKDVNRMKSCGFSHKDNNTEVHIVLYCLNILTNSTVSSGRCHFWDFLCNCCAPPVRLQNPGRLRSEMWRHGVTCTGQHTSFVFVSSFAGSGHVRFISQVEPLVVRQFHTSTLFCLGPPNLTLASTGFTGSQFVFHLYNQALLYSHTDKYKKIYIFGKIFRFRHLIQILCIFRLLFWECGD